MATNPIKLKTRKGDTFTKTVTITGKSSGLPVDLTGFTISGTVKNEIADSTVLQNFVIEARDDANGKFNMVLSSVQTDALSVTGHRDGYVFDLQIDEGGSPAVVTTYLFGSLVVSK